MLSWGLGLGTSTSFLPYSSGQAVTEPDVIQLKRLWGPLLGRVAEKCATILTPPPQGKAARGRQKGAKGSEMVTCHMGTLSRPPWLDTFLPCFVYRAPYSCSEGSIRRENSTCDASDVEEWDYLHSIEAGTVGEPDFRGESEELGEAEGGYAFVDS